MRQIVCLLSLAVAMTFPGFTQETQSISATATAAETTPPIAVQEEDSKVISINEMILHVLTDGPKTFQQNGWTVTFQLLNISPKSSSLQHADTEATATCGKITIHYFVHEVIGYNDKADSQEHTISVRVPLGELTQFLK